MDQSTRSPLKARQLSYADGAGQVFTLQDGRYLSYAIYASLAPTHHIVYFHGMPGSRLEAAQLCSAASSLQLQVISFDKPAIGLSSPLPSRKILDYPSDVAALLDRLRIEAAYLFAVSAGAAYALACAQLFPRDIVEGAGLVAPWLLGIERAGLQRHILNLFAIRLPEFVTEKIIDKLIGNVSRTAKHSVMRNFFLAIFNEDSPASECALAKNDERIDMLVDRSLQARICWRGAKVQAGGVQLGLQAGGYRLSPHQAVAWRIE